MNCKYFNAKIMSQENTSISYSYIGLLTQYNDHIYRQIWKLSKTLFSTESVVKFQKIVFKSSEMVDKHVPFVIPFFQIQKIVHHIKYEYIIKISKN